MTMDERIAMGVSVLDKVGIVDKNNKIQSSFRGQISSFGAAVTTGSLTAAVAFFSKQGQSKTDRGLLMDAIYIMMTCTHDSLKNMTKDGVSAKLKSGNLLNYVINSDNKDKAKKEIIDNAVALKLAMNAYELDKDGNKTEKIEEKSQDGKDGETG